jgi:outer membrane protein assembly factor BamB
MRRTIAAGRALALIAALAVALGACDTVRDLLAEDEPPPLPGERISVLELDRTLEPDPRIADLAVRLPPPYVNPDWPQAGGYPSHAMHHLEAGEALGEVWSTGIGAGSDDDRRLLVSPVVAAGKVFVMDSGGRVAALEAASGERLWRYSLRPTGEEADNALGGGVAYDAGMLFATTGFGEVVALDAETGGQFWRQSIGVPIRAAPTVSAGRVFAVSYDNQLNAFDSRSGALLWNHTGIVEDAGLLGGASPAVAGNIVVVPYSSGELFALRVDSGRIAWSDSLSRGGSITPLATLSDINARPVIDRDRVFAISHAGRLAAIDLRTGARMWERNIGGMESPWVAGDFLYLVTTDAEVLCLSRRDGRIRWVYNLQRFEDEEDREGPITWSGPVLVGDRLIVLSSHGEAWSLSPYDGTPLGGIEIADGAFLPPVVADGVIYILTDDGTLTAYR